MVKTAIGICLFCIIVVALSAASTPALRERKVDKCRANGGILLETKNKLVCIKKEIIIEIK